MGDLTGQKYCIFFEYATFVRIYLRIWKIFATFTRFFLQSKRKMIKHDGMIALKEDGTACVSCKRVGGVGNYGSTGHWFYSSIQA